MSIALTSKAQSFKKVMPIFLAATVLVAVLSFIAFSTSSANAAQPADYGWNEGDRITSYNADGNPDINVVNRTHTRAYSRNFIDPTTCLFYGNQYGVGGCFAVGLRQVTTAQREAFPLSCYFTNGETRDPKVYYRETTGKNSAVLHHVQVSGADAVAADGDFFQKVFTFNTLEQNFYQMGAPYTAMSQVPACVSLEVTGTPMPTGNVTVSLASDNPAAGTLVKSSAANDLAHFQFMGSGSVNSLILKRIGVSADTDLTNVYLYDGARRLTDAASVANGMISFNDTAGLFMVSGSKTIAVKADIGSNIGITMGVELVSYNGNTAAISGNLFTVASGTLAAVTLTTNTDPSTNASLDPASDVIAWRETAAVGTRYVWLKGLQLRVIGSVLPGDLQNFRLYLSGVQIGSAVAQTDSSGYIVFDFTNSPIKLDTGNREFKILVDVIGGSGRNFYISFRQYSDMQVTDSQYNAGIIVTAATSTFPSNGGVQTVASGTLTITKKTDSPAGDVIKGASGVVLARYEFKANGEKMKVENLRAYFDESDNTVSELRNGAIFVDGIQVGSTQNILETSNGVGYTQYSIGSSLTVVPGTPRIVEIRADIADGDSTDNMDTGETMTVGFKIGAANVQRLTTLDYVNSVARDGNQVTIKTGSFTATKYSGFANQNVISPSTNVKVGHFALTVSSAETVNVNTFNLDSDAGGTFLASDLTEMYIKVWNDSNTLIYTSPTKATVSATASNSYSVNFSIPANKTYQVEVYANVATGENAGQSLNLEADATGINAGSSTSTSTGEADGQLITIQAGSLSVNNGSIAAATLAKSGDVLPAYQFTLSPAYDDFILDEVYVDLSSTVASSSGAVAKLVLKEGSTEIGTAFINVTTGSASFTGLNRSIPQSGGTKTYTVDVHLATVGPNMVDTAGLVKVRLDGMKYRPSSGVPVTSNGLSTTTYTGNNILLHATYPTFTNQTLPSTILSSGTQTIFKTAVTSNGGLVNGTRFVFTVAVAAGPTFAGSTIKLYEDGNNVTSSFTLATASYDFNATTGGTGTITFTQITGERVISGHTYEVRVDVAGSIGSGDYITTKIAAPSSSTSGGAIAATVQTAGASVVWSDLSAVNHSTTTEDWMGDYLVKTINISQSLFAGL